MLIVCDKVKTRRWANHRSDILWLRHPPIVRFKFSWQYGCYQHSAKHLGCRARFLTCPALAAHFFKQTSSSSTLIRITSNTTQCGLLGPVDQTLKCTIVHLSINLNGRHQTESHPSRSITKKREIVREIMKIVIALQASQRTTQLRFRHFRKRKKKDKSLVMKVENIQYKTSYPVVSSLISSMKSFQMVAYSETLKNIQLF